MIKRGHNISLCIINDDYTPSLLEQLPNEVEIVKLHRNPGSDSTLNYMKKLSDEVKHRHIQILHCQGVNCVIFAAVAKFLNPHMAVLNTVHTCGNYTSYSDLKIFIQNRICSMTIAISHSIEKEILSRKMSPSKVTTVYNAINTEKFQLASQCIKSKKDSQTQKHDGIQIGCVARIYPAQKGQDTLVKAILLLVNDYPDIHCNFAGDVFKDQEEAYNELLSQIKQHNAEGNFTFCGNVDDIPEFLIHQDIFVLPSHSEAFGIALIEAMSMGLPCVASRLAGPEEILSDPSLGLLFTPGDEYDLADKIKLMINIKDEFDSTKISSYVKENFDIENMVDTHIKLYSLQIK